MRPNTRSELREAASRTLGRCEGQSRAGRQPMLLMRTQGSQSQSVAVRRENEIQREQRRAVALHVRVLSEFQPRK